MSMFYRGQAAIGVTSDYIHVSVEIENIEIESVIKGIEQIFKKAVV